MPESSNGLTFIVNLHAREGQEQRLQEYEARATALLHEHGGRLEKVVRVETSIGISPAPHEVHVVWFPSEEHFQSYRNDARLAELADLRAQAIANTTILIGREVEAYGGA